MMPRRLVLLTRPLAQSARTAQRVRAMGREVLCEPLLDIHPLTPAPCDVPIQAVLLTSANAAQGLKALSVMPDTPVWCVGDATAGAVKALGYRQVHSGGGTAQALCASVRGSLQPHAGVCLHVRGEAVSYDCAADLRVAGFEAESRVVYAARPVRAFSPAVLAALRAREVAEVLLYSMRTAQVFASLAKASDVSLGTVRAICLSEVVAGAAREAGCGDVVVAASPDESAMLACVMPGA